MEFDLPSGAKLLVSVAPFDDAKDLYQACAEEIKAIKFDEKEEVGVNFYKDIICAGVASKRIEAALWKCMERCTYNKLKITKDIFEDVKARQDYFEIQMKVMEQNILPFVKPLMQKYAHIFEMLKGLHQSSKSPTSPS